MDEEKGALEIECEELLPLGQRELVHGGSGPGHDGAPAHGVDQDVDVPMLAHHTLHYLVDLRRVERIGPVRMGAAACGLDSGDRILEPALVVVHESDGATIGADDVGGGPPDPARRGGDERYPSIESHAVLLRPRRAPAPCSP